MPELPEVETTIRELRKKVLHRTFIGLWMGEKKLIKKPEPKVFAKQIIRKTIRKIERMGKLIIIKLSEDKTLLIHQKLTGHILIGRWKKSKNNWEPIGKSALNDFPNKFIHILFYLDNGLMVALSDLRKFAKIELWGNEDFKKNFPHNNIGPDPLDRLFTFEKFKNRIRHKKGKIKQVLMDQKVISGIGNIYSDEILFRAKIHPFSRANFLSPSDLKKIYNLTRKVLKKSISLGGESFSDYRRPDGSMGGFDKFRMIYRRKGENCFICGNIVEKDKVGSRSTYFCRHCQRIK